MKYKIIYFFIVHDTTYDTLALFDKFFDKWYAFAKLLVLYCQQNSKHITGLRLSNRGDSML